MLDRFFAKLASRYPTVNLIVTQQFDVPLRITYADGRFTLHFSAGKPVHLNIGEMNELIKKLETITTAKAATSRAELQMLDVKTLRIVLDEKYTVIGDRTEILLSLRSIAIASGVTL